MPNAPTFEDAKAVILPVPLESTTSYVTGTRNGPREILVASSHLELWDEETNADIHPIGIYTLPEMELPFDDMGESMDEIGRVTADATLNIAGGPSIALDHRRSAHEGWFPAYMSGEL